MNEGSRVLQWAQQHHYTLAWVAQTMGFVPKAFSEALHSNRISQETFSKVLAAMLLAAGLSVLLK